MRATFRPVVLFLSVGVASVVVAQAPAVSHNTWSSGTPLPIPVWVPAVGVIKNQIYVVGGFNAAKTAIADTQIYNPVTNAWKSGTPLPTATEQASGAVVKNILYVIGGSENQCSTVTNVVWAFNPKMNSWSSKSPMPTARCDMGVTVENNIIYVVGGYSPSGGGTRLNTVESYNPATDTWSEEAPLLVGKSEPSVGLVGTKAGGFTIVAADGYGASGDTGDNEAYNVSTNTWTSLKPDPTPRDAACTGSIGSQLYVAGGQNPAGGGSTVTESFKVATNAWKTGAPMPQVSMYAGAAVNQGRLYCIGGTDSYLGNVLNNVHIYQP